jgi:hypothetical protein
MKSDTRKKNKKRMKLKKNQFDKSFHIKPIRIKRIKINSKIKNNWRVAMKFWGAGREIWGGEGE